ncbi:MAG: grasp-with-spasm system ATP-grasp peptide maturase [Bacteroidetes bacterium]|nr:grasp-with-spasm system ATP-grasp peptide maturase [Bacteroidota bacterium]
MNNFVLVFSNVFDITTEKVCSWLNGQFSRINPKDVDKFSKYLTFDRIDRSITAIWQRRGNFPSLNNFFQELNRENKILQDFYLSTCEIFPLSLGSLLKEFNHNKLSDLSIARKCGLNIPFTRIVLNSNQLNGITHNNLKYRLISKPLFNSVKISFKGYDYFGPPTTLIDFPITNFYYPSLIQKYIPKKFEIRSFFLKGRFYSMAIFSQKDPQTKVDFRLYNRKKPNRNIPFQLPKDTERKLSTLMEKLELNTGSIDLIYSPKGEFIFLEVNPVGQFDWLSVNCNYHIERDIAKILSSDAA